MKLLNKKSKSFFILFLLASTLLFGLATSPVLGSVGLDLEFADYTDSLTPSSRSSIAITRDNLYYIFMNTTNLEAHAVSDQSLINSLAGITSSSNQIIIPSSYSGDASDLVYTTDPDSGTVWKLLSYDVSSNSDTVICSDWYDGSSATTKKVYMLSQSYDNKYMVISHDDGGIEQVNMDVGTKTRSFTDLENGLCSPNSLRMIAFNCYTGNPTHVVKMNLQTGLEVANTSLGTLSPYSTSDTRYLDGFGWNRWYDNYYYASFYNNSDNTQFCYVRIKDDLTTYSILIDDSDYWGTNAWRHDITRDGEYIIVTEEGNLDSVMYDIDGTLIATGVNRIQTPTFSYDGSFIVGYRTTTAEIYGYDTDYTIDQGAGDITDFIKYCFRGNTWFYNPSIAYTNLEQYITSFGSSVTIQSVELYIDERQYSYSGEESVYYMWLNGFGIGNPSDIFQSDYSHYVIRWDNIDIDIGDDNMIFEFHDTEGWEYVLLGSEGGAVYHNAFLLSQSDRTGNGIVEGTPYPIHNGQRYGLYFCVYYDITIDDPCDNTYSITPLMNEPVEASNTTEFVISVDGCDNWIAVLYDGNGAVTPQDLAMVKTQTYTTEGDHYFSYVVPPTGVAYGTWTLYVCDDEEFPVGIADEVNYSFTVAKNVSVYGDYHLLLDPTSSLLNAIARFSWNAPVDTHIFIKGECIDGGGTNYGDYFIGTGEFEWSGEVHKLDAVGTWRFVMYEVIDDQLYFRTIDQVKIGTSDTTTFNVPAFKCQDDVLKIGGYISIKNAILHIEKGTEIFTRTLDEGSIFEEFFDVTTLGTWNAYITYNNTILGWANKQFEVKECDEHGNPVDERVDDFLDIYALMTSLPSLYRIIIGVVIIFLLTISPLAVISHLKLKQEINIPPVIYGIMGGTGLCVSTLIGCWGWEIPFMVFALIVMGLFGKFYYDKRGG